MNNLLRIDKVSKSFNADSNPAIDEVSFSIKRGEIVSFVGESGSGKTTLLRLICGDLKPDKGQIIYKDKIMDMPLSNVIFEHEEIKLVNQEFDLMPFLNVQDNVGKFMSNSDREKKKRRVRSLLSALRIDHLASKKVSEISGGEQQRTAIAQALAKTPKLLLLDEPFSHIDHILKTQLRDDLLSELRAFNVGVIMTTHFSEDALAFSDRIGVIRKGKIQQINTPRKLYEDPQDKHVARLFGYVNSFSAENFKRFFSLKINRTEVVIYPEELIISRFSRLKVTIKSIKFMGMRELLFTEIDGHTIIISNTQLNKYKKGELIRIALKSSRKF